MQNNRAKNYILLINIHFLSFMAIAAPEDCIAHETQNCANSEEKKKFIIHTHKQTVMKQFELSGLNSG